MQQPTTSLPSLTNDALRLKVVTPSVSPAARLCALLRVGRGSVATRRFVQTQLYIYESSLRAGPGWRESLYRHQGCLKASDCGRLGRQAAWSPLERAPRGEKLPKDYPTASVLLEAKAAALHPEWYQSLLSKLSTKREGEAGKRSAGNRIG